MITGIIVALPDEINSLTKEKVSKGKCTYINKNTLVTISGAGPENAAIASQLLIDQGASRLISWGCAAALDNTLKPGDLVVAEQLISESGRTLSLQSNWLDHIRQHLSVLKPVSGSLLESSSIVEQSHEKQSLHSQTKAVALDMESIAMAQTAKQHKLPAVVIRSIADPVSMSLPKAVSQAMNEQGEVELGKLLRYLLCHLYEIPDLIKLGLHFGAAKNKLKLVSKHLDIIVGFEQSKVST